MCASFKIGIFGSAGGNAQEKNVAKARALGEALAEHGCTIITGACGGLPYAAAEAASQKGAKVWGFTPAPDGDGHARLYPDQDANIYSRLIYTPREFLYVQDVKVSRKYRNVMSTAECDAGIVIAGRWGTLHEFCALYDYGKVVGVLTNTGGIADELRGLCKKIKKDTGTKVFFNRSPTQLVETIIQELITRKNT